VLDDLALIIEPKDAVAVEVSSRAALACGAEHPPALWTTQ
jgi:hypothetical protein